MYYGKKGTNSRVEVAFYKLRIKEHILEEKKRSVINDFKLLKVKEDTFTSNRDRRILKMKMGQGVKTEIDIVFE